MPFLDLIRALATSIIEVLTFWNSSLTSWWSRKSPKNLLLESLRLANTFEEWNAAAHQLDELLQYDLWRSNPASRRYEVRLICERLQAIIDARVDDDILALVSLLRSGLVRNLGNITTPKLFNHAYAGTKLLIEDYVTQVALAVEDVIAYPPSTDPEDGLANQTKLDILHDTRQAFGRTSLVLQGGSIFGLCHIGVVLALHKQGLLPRIITGTATGALIAALVCVHTEEELPYILTAEGIDLTAFARRSKTSVATQVVSRYNFEYQTWISTSMRRLKRLWYQGHLLDMAVLSECVRANVEDLTFEKAYSRTKRVLNITVPATDGGVPLLLNYLTAPSVLIWSAALASNSSSTLYSTVELLCKDETGNIVPWTNTHKPKFRPTTKSRNAEREAPLTRISELFNVNHFIISQARPYIAPFLRSEFHHTDPGSERTWRMTLPLIRILILEIQHRLSQLDSMGLLPASIKRYLIDESIPGASLVIVPELSPGDFVRLLENPTKDGVNHWIRKGERSVWPVVSALKIRCAVEVELERGYQLVRRRKPFDAATPGPSGRKIAGFSSVSVRKRARTASFGAANQPS